MQQPCVRIPSRIQVDGLMPRIRQILGSMAFGVVYKAVDEEEPWQNYALKEVLCLNASQFHNSVRVREVPILKQLSHENVISLISSAVAYLHFHDIVHLDLKADNLLLTATGDIKLADFGFVREVIPVEQLVEYGDDGSGMMSYIQKCIDSRVSPPHWVAPELFRRQYNKKADVFRLVR